MSGRPPPPAVREAAAFAPGHLTLFFTPDLTARDPRARGSVGVGVCLELGVRAWARWDPSRHGGVRLRSDRRGPHPISRDVARRLVGTRDGRLELELRHELPVGQGFGMSAAAATAVALAVGGVLGTPSAEAWQVAHLADLFGGGGLGGVAALGGGGWELRQRPGIPPYGRVVHRRFAPALLLIPMGRARPSSALLGSAQFLRRLERAGAPCVRLARGPASPAELLEASERFTDRVALGPDDLLEEARALRRLGAWVGQTMFGSSLWAIAKEPPARERILHRLQQRDRRAVELLAARSGARRLAAPRG